MQSFIEEYIDIENNPRNHRKRSQLLSQLLATYPNISHTSFEDLLMMLDQLQHNQTTIRMPIFAQFIYPVLVREIELGNLQAMKVLLRYKVLLNSYNHMMKREDKYSYEPLINRYLQHFPDDHEVLLQKKALQEYSLDFSLHELPHGVLYGMNSATIEGCLKLLDLLEVYKNTCQKLQIDQNDNIRYYAMHFQSYQDYLLHRHLYKNYLDYIHQHNLEI